MNNNSSRRSHSNFREVKICCRCVWKLSSYTTLPSRNLARNKNNTCLLLVLLFWIMPPTTLLGALSKREVWIFKNTLRRVIIYIYIFFSCQIIAMLASSSSSSSSFNSTLLAQSSKGIGCFNLRKLVVYFVNRLAILCENTRRRAATVD